MFPHFSPRYRGGAYGAGAGPKSGPCLTPNNTKRRFWTAARGKNLGRKNGTTHERQSFARSGPRRKSPRPDNLGPPATMSLALATRPKFLALQNKKHADHTAAF